MSDELVETLTLCCCERTKCCYEATLIFNNKHLILTLYLLILP